MARATTEAYNATQRLVGGTETSVAAERTVTSDNEAAVSASVANGAARGTHLVRVNQTVRGQRNIGVALATGSTTTINAGGNAVSVTTGGTTRTVYFEVEPGGTNLETINRIAAHVNAADLPVKATAHVVKNTVRLELASDDTGAATTFIVADTSGNVVATTKVDQVAVPGDDTSLVVDGSVHSSSTSQVDLDNDGLTLSAHLKAAGVTSISVESGTALIQAVRDMAAKVNRLGDIMGSAGEPLGRATRQSLFEPIRERAGALESIGISIQQDRRIVIDADALARAMATNPSRVDSLISGKGGFAAALAEGLSQLAGGTAAVAASLGGNVTGTIVDTLS